MNKTVPVFTDQDVAENSANGFIKKAGRSLSEHFSAKRLSLAPAAKRARCSYSARRTATTPEDLPSTGVPDFRRHREYFSAVAVVGPVPEVAVDEGRPHSSL